MIGLIHTAYTLLPLSEMLVLMVAHHRVELPVDVITTSTLVCTIATGLWLLANVYWLSQLKDQGGRRSPGNH